MDSFTVDIPNPQEPQGVWVEVAAFDTEAEALAFAAEFFGADSDGKIGLVSKIEGEEDEPEPEGA